LFGIWDFGFGILDFLLLGILELWYFGILVFWHFVILELWYFGILSIKKTADLQPTTKPTANNEGNQ